MEPRSTDSAATRAVVEALGSRLRWLHRLGYVTTLIVLLQIVVIGVAAFRHSQREREMTAELIEESRTRAGPIQEGDDSWVRGSAVRQLALLLPLEALHGNGLRFVVMPSFSEWYSLALSFEPAGERAEGVLIVSRPTGEEQVQTSTRRFSVPRRHSLRLMSEFDRMTDTWAGDAASCADGAPAAFERVRGQRVTSGVGNCSPHYRRIRAMMLETVRRFAPGDDVPTDPDWHRYEPEG